MPKTSQRGFTMTEILIAIFLFSMIGIVVVELYRNYGNIFTARQLYISAGRSSSEILREVHETILQSNAILATRAFSGTTYTTGASTLILEMPSINSSGDIIPGTYDHAVFYVTGTDAYEIFEAGTGSARKNPNRHFGDSINALIFTYSTTTPTLSSSVDTRVKTSVTVKGQIQSTDVHESTYLLNK